MAQAAREVLRVRGLRHGPDGVAVIVLLAMGAYLWPGLWGHAPSITSVDAPTWATWQDLLLDGPDAGEWAAAAHAVRRGAFHEVDVHRLPAWPLLVGTALRFLPDVALAGHAVNHGMQLLLPLVVYGLGRWRGGVGVGLGAGVLVALFVPLAAASRRFGVDIAVSFLLSVSLLAALLPRRHVGLAPLAGAVAGFAALSHYTALPYVVPAAFLAGVATGPGPWRRAGALLGHLLGAAGMVLLLAHLFQLPDARTFLQTVSEGIAPGEGANVPPGRLSPAARSTLVSGWNTALDEAVSQMVQLLRPPWIPWYAALALPWLGVAGFGLGPGARSEGEPSGSPSPARPSAPRRLWRGLRRRGRLADPGTGLVFLLCLAPLPVFAAAEAPERYGWNLFPFAALLWMRGAGSLAALADRGLRHLWRRWPRGLLAMAAAVALVWPAIRDTGRLLDPMPPPPETFSARRLGSALATHFEPGGGARCEVREAAAHAGRAYCPRTPCPFQATERAFNACLSIMARECGETGPIPYVILEKGSSGGTSVPPGSEAHLAMDAWVQERWEALETVRTRHFVATIVAIPRADLPEDPVRTGPEGPPNPTGGAGAGGS